MRKISLALAMALAVALLSNSAYAQNDGFFNNWRDSDNRESIDGGIEMPGLPASHGFGEDQSGETPLGTGLLIMTALGVGYAATKRKNE